MGTSPSDKDIIHLFTGGKDKEKAFSMLVKKYQKPLYWQIRRIVKNHENTDDILQNTWLKVWKNLDRFKGDSALYTWLYRIATNEAYSFLNTAYVRKYFPTDEPLVTGTETNGPDGTEIEKMLFTAIQKLPEKQQIVFQMKYFDELKFSEISEILGTSIGALKASYHHAVKKIEHDLTNRLNL